MSGIITAIAGLVVAISALIANWFSYRKTQAEADKLRAETEKIRSETQAEANKLRVETEEIRSETAEIGSRAANAETIARRAYQASPAPQSLMLYDSASGFSLFDFKSDRWEGAAGELSLASSASAEDDILVITRNNAEGKFVVWLKSYGYRDRPDVIPVGEVAGKNGCSGSDARYDPIQQSAPFSLRSRCPAHLRASI